ncbi:MAG: hypothetical protein J6386_10685 [Candidatus Synoicihabitans palmerolidicus]|nr:hypothetical protein [Candidatus Synoicihabitans palmerolidicus]
MPVTSRLKQIIPAPQQRQIQRQIITRLPCPAAQIRQHCQRRLKITSRHRRL